MKKIVLFFLVVWSFAVFSCEFSVENYCAQVKFNKGISRSYDSVFHIQFVDKETKKLKFFDKIDLKLWMVMKNGHAHGSEEVKIMKDKTGYTVSNVWFLMLGQWYFNITLSGNGKQVLGDIPICVMKNSNSGRLGKCN